MGSSDANSTQSESRLLRSAVRNSVFGALGPLLAIAVGFVFAGLTIRYLGESRAGYLISVNALLGVGQLVSGAGLSVPTLARLARYLGEKDASGFRDLLGTIVTINISLGVGLTVCFLSVLPKILSWSGLESSFAEEGMLAAFLLSIGYTFAQGSATYSLAYQAHQRYDITTVVGVGFGLLSGMTGIVVLNLKPSMVYLAGTNLLVASLRLGVDFVLTRRLTGNYPWPRWAAPELRPLFGLGRWTYLGGVGGFLFTNADRIVFTSLLGSSSIPFYAFPQRIYSQIHTTLSSQSEYLFPMLSSLGKGARQELGRLYDRLRWYTALLSGFIYCLTALVLPWVFRVLVSEQFAERASAPLYLTCIQGFAHAQMIVPYFCSWSLGHGAPNTLAQLTNGVLVILSTVILVPRLGYIGASFAQLNIIVVAVLHIVWVQRLIFGRIEIKMLLACYVSPMAGIAMWFLSLCVWRFIGESNTTSVMLFSALGLIASVVIVYWIEARFFHSFERISTLRRAIHLVATKTLHGRSWGNF